MAKRKVSKRRDRAGEEMVKFLVMLPADAIKALKLETIERSVADKRVTASSILEMAVRA